MLSINGEDLNAATAFAGCFDKIPGVEYEDCYFSATYLSPELISWFQDSASGANPTRSMTIYLFDANFNVAATMGVTGFLREFSVGPIDATATSSTPVGASFVVVPSSITANYDPPNASLNFIGSRDPGLLLSTKFGLKIDGINFNYAISVGGLRLSWQKLTQSSSGARMLFAPGAIAADRLILTFAMHNDNTADYLQQWMSDTASGSVTPKAVSVELFSGDLQTVLRTIVISNVVPTTFLPFGISASLAVLRSSLTAQMGIFTIQ